MSTVHLSSELSMIDHPRKIVEVGSRHKCNRSFFVKTLFFCTLLILVLSLIVALVAVLLRGCPGEEVRRKGPDPIKKIERINNLYWNMMELPNFAIPTTYYLTLQFLNESSSLQEHLEADQFDGQMVLNFTMKSDSKFLVLHSKKLSIKNLVVTRKESTWINVVEVIIDEDYDQLIVVCGQPLFAGMDYLLNITYSGKISLNETGVIRTFYRNITENKSFGILYSDLEPIGARRMFPCFDEPDLKALFSVKIIHYWKYTALSNMPLIRRHIIPRMDLIAHNLVGGPNSSFAVSLFNTTFIKMSTYLLAFVLVEDYEATYGFRKAGFYVSIWAPRGFQEDRGLPLRYASATENFFERYLNFSNLMPKSDHVYIPSYISGAIENWGLMLYREERLLVSWWASEVKLRRAYMTIGHEIAHIWFGNWVTMKTWTDLWLNEGFATYFASLAYYKQRGVMSDQADRLFLGQHRMILETDGQASSFPVRKSVDFKTLFNRYTYLKGQSLLVWLHHIVGERNFRLGFQSYVKKFAEKNPTTEDFFSEMESKAQESGRIIAFFGGTLNDFFRPWLDRTGYPIVRVTYDIARKKMIMSQRSVQTNVSANDPWPIYTSYKTQGTPMDRKLFFGTEHFEMNIEVGDQGFVILNGEGKSYLRINYSSYLWSRIIESIKMNHWNINLLNKIVLLDDNLYFAENDLIPLSITKDMMDTLVNETDVVPWMIFHKRMLRRVQNLLGDDQVYLKWNKYALNLSSKVIDRAFAIDYGRDISVDEQILQAEIFKIGCELGNPRVLTLVSGMFRTWITNSHLVGLPRHLTTLVLYIGMKTNDDEQNWMKMWHLMVGKDRFRSISKEQLAIGLAGTSKPYLLNKLLNYLLMPHTHHSDVSKYYFCTDVVSSILKDNNGINVIRRWIMGNYDRIKAFAFGDNTPRETSQKYLESILSSMASVTYDLDALRPLLDLHRDRSSLTKKVMLNNHWRENVGKILSRYIPDE